MKGGNRPIKSGVMQLEEVFALVELDSEGLLSADDGDFEPLLLLFFLFLLNPPPTGTFLSEPPLVQ